MTTRNEFVTGMTILGELLNGFDFHELKVTKFVGMQGNPSTYVATITRGSSTISPKTELSREGATAPKAVMAAIGAVWADEHKEKINETLLALALGELGDKVYEAQ
jgi:hypothetical protein